METSSVGIFHKEKINLFQTKGFIGLTARSRFSMSAMKITEKATATHPICTNPTPLIIDRSLNTPHQRHYSSYLLISAFWGGVVKDRKAVFSPNYVHLKNFWGLMLLLVFLSAKLKLWNLILVAMLCKLETRPQLARFVSINAIAFKSFFSPCDQKSVL